MKNHQDLLFSELIAAFIVFPLLILFMINNNYSGGISRFIVVPISFIVWGLLTIAILLLFERNDAKRNKEVKKDE